jgi:3-oxoacyl-[acyl-carrier-protein] synthase III
VATTTRKEIVPTEAYEGRMLADWLDAKGVLYTHIASESSSRRQGIRNKQQGVRKGAPDYVIVLKSKVLFIELKRRKGGRVSAEQKVWVERLTAAGAHAKVCLGWLEAKSFVEEHL